MTKHACMHACALDYMHAQARSMWRTHVPVERVAGLWEMCRRDVDGRVDM